MPHNFFSTRQARRLSGFTLIELLAVMAIISFSVFLVSGPLQGRTDNKRIDQTLTLMAEIETALLGQELQGEPQLRTAGYIPDLGTLPELIDGQPMGLWTPDTDKDSEDDLLRRCQFISDGYAKNWGFAAEATPLYIWMGWRGPYLSPPRDGVLRDAWGNALIFQPDTPEKGDLTIVSPGANGIVSDQDAGADSDIKAVIRRSRFTAPVSGVIIPSGINTNNSREDIVIRLYYSAPGPDESHEDITDLTFMVADMQDQGAVIAEDGYFLFPEVPVGTDRLLEISQPMLDKDGNRHTVLTYIRFEVLPTLNWLGRIDIRNSYDMYPYRV